MKRLINYIDERNKAMMSYPDTSKLDDLVLRYNDMFDPIFKAKWKNAEHSVKVRTLQTMIENWADAPTWLIRNVENDRRREKE